MECEEVRDDDNHCAATGSRQPHDFCHLVNQRTEVQPNGNEQLPCGLG